MARAGDELVNPATGLRTVFRETARTTNGELLQVDWIGDPGWTTGPDHLHPHQEERFEVLSGSLGLRVAGVEQAHDAGDAIVVPASVPHAAWNAGDGAVHVLVDFRPALGTEIAFETLAGLARDRMTTAAGVPEIRCGWRSSCASSRTRSASSDRRWPSRERSWVLWPCSRGCSGTERNTPIDRTCAMRRLDRAAVPGEFCLAGRSTFESRTDPTDERSFVTTVSPDISIAQIRADLAGQVIGPDDPGTTRAGRSSCPRSTAGPR